MSTKAELFTPRVLEPMDAAGVITKREETREQIEERVTKYVVGLEHEADVLAGTVARLKTQKPQQQTATPAIRPTADTILDSMAEISARLTNGSMTAADAKARLYAHQIALSAMRTIDTAEARRKKEARLWKTARSTTKANRNPSAASSTKPRKASPKRRKKQPRPANSVRPKARAKGGRRTNSTAVSGRRSGIARS